MLFLTLGFKKNLCGSWKIKIKIVLFKVLKIIFKKMESFSI
jgi:hypothetical protein